MKNDIAQAISDINTWKAKFEALDRSKNRELDDLRFNYENNFKNQFER